jgi:hypothetical protein
MVLNMYMCLKNNGADWISLNARSRQPKCACVRKYTVSHVCREAKKGKEGGTEKVLLLSSKHTNNLKRVTYLDEFQEGVLCRTVLKYYDKGECPTVKSNARFREKVIHNSSVHIVARTPIAK